MPTSAQSPLLLRFDRFEVDLRSGDLRKDGKRLRLQDQPFRVLRVLLENPGQLVTREDLKHTLWPDDTFVDFDDGLNTAVKKIRDLLGDSSGQPRYIETIPRRGYRFIGTLTQVALSPVVPGTSAADGHKDSPLRERAAPLSAAADLQPAKTASLRRAAVLVLLSLFAVIALSFVMFRPSPASQPAIKSLAVLPLKNLSGDSSQDYLADGMTEALIGRLSGIRDLRVISRTSSMHFKDTQLSVPEIARTLHVDAIVEGSVIRDGNRIRVHAQLIRAATDEHIWAGESERESKSILDLQEDVTRTIADHIQSSVNPTERAAVPRQRVVDQAAYEDYLKGRFYFNQRTPDAMNKSIAFFQEAIARDPNYALPYSGLADTYAILGFRGGFPSHDALAAAKTAAMKAIELDDTLAEPHASLAFIAEIHEWDWATAEREYLRALERNPGDARAHHWYAGYLVYVGRISEGVAEEEKARNLDPLSLPVNTALAGRLLCMGRNDEALAQVRRTLELDPHFPPAHQTLGWAYLHTGKPAEAVQEFQEALTLSGSEDTDFLLDLGFAEARTGNRDAALKILAKLKEGHDRGRVPSGAIGILYGALGDLDQAFYWLNKAYQERDPELTYLNVPNRRFDPVNRDPRFKVLLHRVGLS